MYIEHHCNIVSFLMDIRAYEVLLPFYVKYLKKRSYVYFYIYAIYDLVFILHYYASSKTHDNVAENSVQSAQRVSNEVTSHNVTFRAIFLSGYPDTVSFFSSRKISSRKNAHHAKSHKKKSIIFHQKFTTRKITKCIKYQKTNFKRSVLLL